MYTATVIKVLQQAVVEVKRGLGAIAQHKRKQSDDNIEPAGDDSSNAKAHCRKSTGYDRAWSSTRVNTKKLNYDFGFTQNHLRKKSI